MIDQFIDDDEDESCPLCVEEFDLSDKNFRPCPCGYQICQFCYNNIRTTLNGLCPACRRPYDDNSIEWKSISPEEMANYRADQALQAKRKAAARQKEAQKKEAESLNRKHLAGLRVVQKNLVYVTGLVPNTREPKLLDILRTNDYFGQYGDIVKIVVSKPRDAAGPHPQSVGVYVTYRNKEDAATCIACVNGSRNGDRILKAQYGTTKYCSAYLRHETCTNRNCMFLHEAGDENETFTRRDMSAMNAANNQHMSSTGSQSNAQNSAANTPAPSHATPHHENVLPVMSGFDNQGLPSSASWADKSQPGTLPVGRSSREKEAGVSEGSPAPSASELSQRDSQSDSDTQPPSHQSDPGAEKNSDEQEACIYHALAKTVFRNLRFAFSAPSSLSQDELRVIKGMPQLWDWRSATHRQLLHDKRVRDIQGLPVADFPTLDNDNFQFGAEPDGGADSRSDNDFSHLASRAPGPAGLRADPSQAGVGAANLSLSQIFKKDTSQHSGLGGGLIQQSPNEQTRPNSRLADSSKPSSSKFTGQGLTGLSLQDPAHRSSYLLPLSTNQFYSPGPQGPPPGLKTTGTPPASSGGNAYNQANSYLPSGLAFAAPATRSANDEAVRELLRAQRPATGSNQLSEAGKQTSDQLTRQAIIESLSSRIGTPTSSMVPLAPPGFEHVITPGASQPPSRLQSPAPGLSRREVKTDEIGSTLTLSRGNSRGVSAGSKLTPIGPNKPSSFAAWGSPTPKNAPKVDLKANSQPAQSSGTPSVPRPSTPVDTSAAAVPSRDRSVSRPDSSSRPASPHTSTATPASKSGSRKQRIVLVSTSRVAGGAPSRPATPARVSSPVSKKASRSSFQVGNAGIGSNLSAASSGPASASASVANSAGISVLTAASGAREEASSSLNATASNAPLPSPPPKRPAPRTIRIVPTAVPKTEPSKESQPASSTSALPAQNTGPGSVTAPAVASRKSSLSQPPKLATRSSEGNNEAAPATKKSAAWPKGPAVKLEAKAEPSEKAPVKKLQGSAAVTAAPPLSVPLATSLASSSDSKLPTSQDPMVQEPIIGRMKKVRKPKPAKAPKPVKTTKPDSGLKLDTEEPGLEADASVDNGPDVTAAKPVTADVDDDEGPAGKAVPESALRHVEEDVSPVKQAHSALQPAQVDVDTSQPIAIQSADLDGDAAEPADKAEPAQSLGPETNPAVLRTRLAEAAELCGMGLDDLSLVRDDQRIYLNPTTEPVFKLADVNLNVLRPPPLFATDQESDDGALHFGGQDGSCWTRSMITPNGQHLRCLTVDEEQRYLKLEKALDEHCDMSLSLLSNARTSIALDHTVDPDYYHYNLQPLSDNRNAEIQGLVSGLAPITFPTDGLRASLRLSKAEGDVYLPPSTPHSLLSSGVYDLPVPLHTMVSFQLDGLDSGGGSVYDHLNRFIVPGEADDALLRSQQGVQNSATNNAFAQSQRAYHSDVSQKDKDKLDMLMHGYRPPFKSIGDIDRLASLSAQETVQLEKRVVDMASNLRTMVGLASI